MHSPFIGGRKVVLKEWKALRASLSGDQTDQQQLSSIVAFWSQAPLSARFLDWDKPEDWPDAWQMMYSGDFDESMIALGMFNTLLLGDDQRWAPDRLSIMLIRDHARCIQRLILKVDDNWLLNLDYGIVVDGSQAPQKFMVQQIYGYDGKSHSIIDQRPNWQPLVAKNM